MVEVFKTIINLISAIAIPLFIVIFLGWGLVKKVKVYEVFVEGAKEGFATAVRIIPFLVAMLLAIGVFRASGAMDVVVAVLSPATDLIGMPAEVMPLALLRPLSGSGSMGLMTELMNTHGPDSFIGVLASTMFGSTETTFYILAVYFGSVGIKNTRHALPAGLIADFFGMIGAVIIVRMLFSL
ncbi:MAG: spore maturation protein [Bacteroidota bacterium]